MMVNRGTANGIECDAFSRNARRMLSWRCGELRAIKRQFSKRIRKLARQDAQTEARHRSEHYHELVMN